METQIKSHFLIVGVMIRFRQEQLAVLENTEFTFYQVLASEENISFLKFLWWKDGDLNNTPIDYEMGRHVLVVFHHPVAVITHLRRHQTITK